MKRYDHLYEKSYDLENLRKAHQHAKKGKGWYREVQEIDKDPDKYLKQIQEMLINHTFEKINLSGNGKENDRYQEQSGSREHDELFRVVFNQFLQRLVEIC